MDRPRVRSLATDLSRQIKVVVFLAREQLYRRYCRSMLGLAWSLLQPLSYILVLTFVFTVIMPVNTDRFVIYLSAGLMPWTLLSNALATGTRSLADRRTILESSPLDGLVFILADTSTEVLSFLPGYGLLVTIVVAMRPDSLLVVVALPFVLLPLVLFVYSGAVAIAYLSTRFNDMPHLLQIILTIMFWLVPIVYNVQSVPPEFLPLIKLNPITLLISPSQIVLHGGVLPTAKHMAAAFGLAFCAMAGAGAICWKLRRQSIFHL